MPRRVSSAKLTAVRTFRTFPPIASIAECRRISTLKPRIPARKLFVGLDAIRIEWEVSVRRPSRSNGGRPGAIQRSGCATLVAWPQPRASVPGRCPTSGNSADLSAPFRVIPRPLRIPSRQSMSSLVEVESVCAGGARTGRRAGRPIRIQAGNQPAAARLAEPVDRAVVHARRRRRRLGRAATHHAALHQRVANLRRAESAADSASTTRKSANRPTISTRRPS